MPGGESSLQPVLPPVYRPVVPSSRWELGRSTNAVTGAREDYAQPEATRRAQRLTGVDFGASPPTAVSRQPMTDGKSSSLLAGRNIPRRVLSQSGEQE